MTGPGSTDERRPSGIGVTPPSRQLGTQPKRRSAAQSAGAATRTLAGGIGGLPTSPVSVVNAIGSAVVAAFKPVHQAAGKAGGDFATGFTGSPRTLPPKSGAQAAPAPAATAPTTLTGGEAPAAVAKLPNAPAKPTAGVMQSPKPGAPQTYTNGDQVTRQLPSYAPPGGVQSQPFGGTAKPVQRTLSQPVVAPDSPTRHMGPRVQGGVIPSTPGMEAGVYGGEAKRRLENALITTGVGSPSVRRGLIEAYTQQQGAQNTAALADQNAGAAMDLQQQRGVMDANEAFAGRRLDASALNLKSALTQQQTETKGQRVMRTLTDQAGNTNVLRNDGSLTPVTDAAGNPVQEQSTAGQVTPKDRFNALNDQAKTIRESMALSPAAEGDPRLAHLATIEQQMAAFGGKATQPIKRTGTLNGRKVVEYADGTVEYQD